MFARYYDYQSLEAVQSANRDRIIFHFPLASQWEVDVVRLKV